MSFVDVMALAIVLAGVAAFVVSLKWLSSRYLGSTDGRDPRAITGEHSAEIR
jgi:hypothetical protein